MKLIGFMCVLDEVEYIEYAIRSTINELDELIVIEGAWGCSALATGKISSDDGTLEILARLGKEFKHLKVYHRNDVTQIAQRTAVFQYIKEDCWMLLQDADEIYTHEQIAKVKELITSNPPQECFKFDSLTFINDFYHYTNISFPRLFRIRKGNQYKFIAPNTLSCNGQPIPCVEDKNIDFYHYSYVKSHERFMEKKKERVYLHGEFKWESNGDMVCRPGVTPNELIGNPPEILKSHPRYGIRKECPKTPPEIIIFIQHSGIGNLIHITPCLKAIRSIKPNAQIYVLCWTRSARILEGLDFIDLVVSSNNQKFINSLGRKVDHLIISPVGSIVNESILARCINIHRHEIKAPWIRHEVEVNMDFAKKLGYKGVTHHAEIKIYPYNFENISGTMTRLGLKKNKFICIAASYLKEKQWVLKHWGNEKYDELIDAIVGMGISDNIVFIGSKNDHTEVESYLSKHRGRSDRRVHNLCGLSEDIKDTAALIYNSNMVVGNDGALMHIAAALDIPTVTIFTFTNILKNMPINPKGKLVMTPCTKRIACQHGGWEQCQSKGCMNVTVDMVIKAIKELK